MFIVIEGIDGSGKTTLAKQLVSELCHEEKIGIYQRFPDNTAYGILAGRASQGYEKILLHCLDFTVRNRWLEPESKLPGRFIVCDRYWMSTYAYNCQTMYDKALLDICRKNLLKPDLVVFLDTPVEEAVFRIKQRNLKGLKSTLGLLPDPDEKTLQRASDRYSQLIEEMQISKEPYMVLNGVKSVEENLAIAWERIIGSQNSGVRSQK